MATKKRTTKAKKVSSAQRGSSAWTPEHVDLLCDLLEEGGTIRSFCTEHNLARASLNKWRRQDRELDARIQAARQTGTEALEEEFVEVTSRPELMVNVGTAAKPKWVATSDDVQHRKLRAWGLEKRMAWNNAGRYGDKLQVGGAADLPPVSMSVEERRARAAALLAKVRKRRKETKGEQDTEA
jgi:hypothetical protein